VRILFSCLPGIGHFHPLVPLARAAQRAGHDVAFVTGRSLHGAVTAEGFTAYRSAPDELHPFIESTFAAVLGRDPRDAARLAGDRPLVFRHVFAGARVPLAAPAIHDVAAALGADLVVHEPADLAAPLAAARLDRPSAMVGFGLLFPDEVLAAAEEGVADSWQAVGLTPPRAAGLFEHLYLDPVPRTLQPARIDDIPTRRTIRPAVYGAGEQLPPEIDALGRQRPLAYVTHGTIFGDEAVLATTAGALAAEGCDVVVTVGPRGDPGALAGCGPHVVALPFVPQGAVLPRSRLVVTHGGSGTVLGALANGVPMLLTPRGADQYDNAAAVTGRGAGLTLQPHELDELAVRQAVRRLLDDAHFSGVAQELAAEIAQAREPAEALGLLEELAERR
jgi:UDP:flavonoid glycosyltransferase YjiC (YdhE family)